MIEPDAQAVAPSLPYRAPAHVAHDQSISGSSHTGPKHPNYNDLAADLGPDARAAIGCVIAGEASRATLDDRVPPSFAASGRQDLNLRPLDPQNFSSSVPARQRPASPMNDVTFAHVAACRP